MEYRVIKKNEQTEGKWSGGKTVELGICPEGANVKNHDFVWRLSSVTYDSPDAEIKEIPGYARIMIPIGEDGEKRDYSLLVKEGVKHSEDVIDQIEAGAAVNSDKAQPVGENGEASFMPIDAIMNGKRVPITLKEEEGFGKVTQTMYCVDGFSSVHLEITDMSMVSDPADAPVDIKILRLTQGEQLIAEYSPKEKIRMTIKGAGRLVHCQLFSNE